MLVIATLCWGGNFVIARAVHADMPPMSLTFWRWVMACLLLFPLSGRALFAHRALVRRHFYVLLGLSLTGVAIFHSFVYIALHTTTAVNASLVLAVMPMVIPLFSYLINGDRLSSRQIAGIGVSSIGILIIISRADWSVLTRLSFTPGDLWILGAVISWSIYSSLLKRLPREMPSLVMLQTIMMIGIVLVFPFYLREVYLYGGFTPSPANLAAIAYVAIFASIVAFLSWNKAVHEVGANKAGLFIHLIPLFSAFLAILLLGERLQGYHFAGLPLILAGIYLTTRGMARGRENIIPRSVPDER
ncbi:DMT family transporter [Varunaivibrio sulfuroxidans]|uniref:DMT family transporter n=1 Tax=Varunaivibrio sulfuroxidans TaxID=1773489 RepID=UPI0023EA6A3C|nr:DMT family transporter [Varunaivibrio sulfuroxidans]